MTFIIRNFKQQEEVDIQLSTQKLYIQVVNYGDIL